MPNPFDWSKLRKFWRGKPKPSPPLQLPQIKVEAPAIVISPSHWPQQRDCMKFYGPVGEHQTRLVFPYPCYYEGQVMRSTSCHMKVHDAAMRVFEKVLERYGKDQIHKLKLDVFDGCLNVRPMRGGTEYSMHSWGIAFDFCAAHNQLKWGKERALFGRKEYEGWFEAWESQGATSLGRSRNFDWMHTQFTRL